MPPKSVLEWVAWSDARAKWSGSLSTAVEANKGLVDNKARWANWLVRATAGQVAFALALALSALARL